MASSSDLWEIFENYYFDTEFELKDGVQFTDFVTSWTNQVGYPVISVTDENSRNQFRITQVKLTMVY